MRNILCFGDSNTFGTIPGGGGRWPRETRWTGRLQMLLGENYYVIEEGCGGRTSVWNDDLEGDKNGKEHLPVVLATHKPLDLVIIMLGTNDFKSRFHVLPVDIAEGIRQLAEIVQKYPYGEHYRIPKVLIVSPILLGNNIENSCYSGFENSAVLKSHQLADLIRRAANLQNCEYLNAAEYAAPSPRDFLHMEDTDHEKLAHAIADKIKNMFQEHE